MLNGPILDHYSKNYGTILLDVCGGLPHDTMHDILGELYLTTLSGLYSMLLKVKFSL